MAASSSKNKAKVILDPEIRIWNESVLKLSPYSDIINALGVKIVLNFNEPLFVNSISEVKDKIEVPEINWRLVVSAITIAVPPGFNSSLGLDLPESQQCFIGYIVRVVRKIVNESLIETVSNRLYDVSCLPNKRKPSKGILGLLDQIFISKPRGTVYATFDRKIETIFDVDIASNIPVDIPRLFRSELVGVCSNNLYVYNRHFAKNYPFSSEQSILYHSLLERTRRGKSYANLATGKASRESTVQKLDYINVEHRVAGDDKEIFDFIISIIDRYRDPAKAKAKVNSKSESKVKTVRIKKNKGKKSNEDNETPVKKKGKRKAIGQNIRYKLWHQYFLTVNGLCHCCQCKISFADFEAGHVVSDADGGEVSLDNLRPICRGCNRGMGTMNMFEYIKLHKFPGPPDQPETTEHDKTLVILSPKIKKRTLGRKFIKK